MGKAEISSGGEDGLYSAAILYDKTVATKTIEAIDKEIEQLRTDIDAIWEDIQKAWQEVGDAKRVLAEKRAEWLEEIARAMVTQEIEFIPPDRPIDVSFADPDWLIHIWALEMKASLGGVLEGRLNEAVHAAFKEVLIAAGPVWVAMNKYKTLHKKRDQMYYRIESLERRREQLSQAIADAPAQSMWCADLTEDLAGEVDTIEIKGAPDQILIAPAGVTNLEQSKLANIAAMSSAQAGLAWALLPGWQKWRPTYRVGRIHGIDYDADTASVTLDAATSIAQRLNVNQAGTLTDIPVDYMHCNAAAFESGDRVVVEFPGQLWDTGPKVIGFETNPQSCCLGLPAFHTYDEGGNWLGITVCTSGQWGPPYEFYECDQSAVFAFNLGQWNNYNGSGTRPNAEYYKARTITGTDMTEIPATHEYVGAIETDSDNQTSVNSSSWSSGPYIIDVVAPSCERHNVRGARDYNYLNYDITAQRMKICSGAEDNILKNWARRHDRSGPCRLSVGGGFCEGPCVPPTQDCGLYYGGHVSLALANMGDVDDSCLLNSYTSDPNGPNACGLYWWNITWQYSGDVGVESHISWFTFAGEDAADCGYVYADYVDQSFGRSWRNGYFTHGSTPNSLGTAYAESTTTVDAVEHINAFGTEYTLAEYPAIENYLGLANRITAVKPRLYIQSDKCKFFLCSIRRGGSGAASNTWEYALFRISDEGDITQYNDSDATFEGGYLRHSIGISATLKNGEVKELWSNGSFSLVRRAKTEEEGE
jgi:hypothetical protein